MSIVQVGSTHEVGLASRTGVADKKTKKRKLLRLVNDKVPVIVGIIFAMIVVHRDIVHSAS